MSERTALATYCQGLDELADRYEEPLRSQLRGLSQQVLAAFKEASDEVSGLRRRVDVTTIPRDTERLWLLLLRGCDSKLS